MKLNWKETMLIGLIAGTACIFVLFMWRLSRTINYKLSYQSMVQDEIRAMVKKECLK